jgi:hypothetical protein
MNAFADWLFIVLLGWTGRTANRFWSSFSKGENGFASLLSKIWLPLLIIIVAVCTVIDLIIRFKHRRIYSPRREKQARLEHMEMREAMEHGEMAKEYRDEMAHFVNENDSPFIEDGFFTYQDEYAYPASQDPNFVEYPDEPQFFEPQQDMYAEPQFYQNDIQDVYYPEYIEQDAEFNEIPYQENASGQYDEESAVKHHVRYERNRRSDRWKKRRSMFSKNHNSEDYNENQNYEYQEYSQNGHEQYRNDR